MSYGDRLLRELERRAMEGDEQAAQQLDRERYRRGLRPARRAALWQLGEQPVPPGAAAAGVRAVLKAAGLTTGPRRVTVAQTRAYRPPEADLIVSFPKTQRAAVDAIFMNEASPFFGEPFKQNHGRVGRVLGLAPIMAGADGLHEDYWLIYDAAVQKAMRGENPAHWSHAPAPKSQRRYATGTIPSDVKKNKHLKKLYAGLLTSATKKIRDLKWALRSWDRVADALAYGSRKFYPPKGRPSVRAWAAALADRIFYAKLRSATFSKGMTKGLPSPEFF